MPLPVAGMDRLERSQDELHQQGADGTIHGAKRRPPRRQDHRQELGARHPRDERRGDDRQAAALGGVQEVDGHRVVHDGVVPLDRGVGVGEPAVLQRREQPVQVLAVSPGVVARLDPRAPLVRLDQRLEAPAHGPKREPTGQGHGSVVRVGPQRHVVACCAKPLAERDARLDVAARSDGTDQDLQAWAPRR
jgi:hypothetical protein